MDRNSRPAGRDRPRSAQGSQPDGEVAVEEALVKLGYADADDIMKAKAEQHGLPFVELREIEIPASVIELVPESLARENIVMPLSQESGSIRVIMHDPLDFETIDKLRFVLEPRDRGLAGAQGSDRRGDQQVLRQRHHPRPSRSTRCSRSSPTPPSTSPRTAGPAAKSSDHQHPGGRGRAGHQAGAPDHPGSGAPCAPATSTSSRSPTGCGSATASTACLMERDNAPRRLLGAIVSRIKIMGFIDIAEKRRPQDGRIKILVAGKDIDMRVSIIPTSHGQSVVMRILDRENIKVGLQDLGFGDEDFARFKQLIKRPNGILLVTGPTGSGKTTTLYAALNELNRPDVKIITAEDPVEYYLPGVNQCEVKAKIGMTFARIIRAMLRQNPNILLVGEIRDLETAETAIQASLTGHLVFSTLHTNDAPSAITRLVDIGIQPFLVASSVLAIMAQRLVRKVCPKCKMRYEPPAHLLAGLGLRPEIAKKANFMKGKGCNHCNKKGYRGRMGIYELMTMTPQVREMAFKGESTQNVRKMARKQGMRTLFEDGIIKAIRGITTIDEVLRITQRDMVSETFATPKKT